MAKVRQRTPKHQEYRDNLAHDLKILRQRGNTGRELAKSFLENEQETTTYKEAIIKNPSKKQIDRYKNRNTSINNNIFDEKNLKNVPIFSLNIDLAKQLIRGGKKNLVAIYANKFEPSDEIIELFLSINWKDSMGYKRWLVDYLFIMKNTGLLSKKSVEKLLDDGLNIDAIICNLDKFEGLDNELLFKILDHNISIEAYEHLLWKLKYFNGMNKETFLALVSYNGNMKNKEGLKYPYLDKLESIIRRSPRGGNPWENYFGKNLDKFEGLDEEIAKILIEKGFGRYIAEYPEKFGLKKEE